MQSVSIKFRSLSTCCAFCSSSRFTRRTANDKEQFLQAIARVSLRADAFGEQ